MPSQSLSSAFRFPRWTQIPVNELIPSSQDEDQQVAPEIKSRRVYLMGTVCTLKYLSWKPEKAFGQMESMVRILEEAESELSTWKDESFISRLNRLPVGVPMETGPSSIALFLKLRYWSKETQQTFDPTVGKLLQAYEIKTGGRWPTAGSIETAQLDMGMQHYKLDGKRHRITKTRDIHMDAGSFGKGEALTGSEGRMARPMPGWSTLAGRFSSTVRRRVNRDGLSPSHTPAAGKKRFYTSF